MQKSLFAIAAALALAGCSAGPRYMNETTQAMTVVSDEGALCSGMRQGQPLFSIRAGETVTISKSKNPISVECRLGDRIGRAQVESSMDSLSMSPLWDYASGALNRYPSTVSVSLGERDGRL